MSETVPKDNYVAMAEEAERLQGALHRASKAAIKMAEYVHRHALVGSPIWYAAGEILEPERSWFTDDPYEAKYVDEDEPLT